MTTRGWIRSVVKLGCSIVLLLTVPGCWDYQRINYRDQIIGIGVDPLPNNPNQMLFTFQIPTFGSTSSNQSGQGEQKSSAASSTQVFKNYSVTGESFNEALTSAQTESDWTFFIGNIEAIVLNEHLTKNQVQGLVAEFIRTAQMNSTTTLVATPVSARQLLETGGEAAPAETINRYDESVKQVAYKTRRKLWEFWRDLNAVGIEPVTGVVTPQKDHLRIAGTMVFHQTKPEEELGTDDTLSCNLLIGKAQGFSILVHDGKQTFTVYVFKCRSNRSAAVSGQGPPNLKARLHLWGFVEQDESKGTLKLTEPEMARYQAVMAREITARIQATIQHLQRDQADTIGFGRALLYTRPDLESTIAEEWGNLFSTARVNIEVKVSLIQKGRLI
jgi:spore germination protein KC